MQQLITIETVPISIRYVRVEPESNNEEGASKLNKSKPHDTAPKKHGPTPVRRILSCRANLQVFTISPTGLPPTMAKTAT